MVVKDWALKRSPFLFVLILLVAMGSILSCGNKTQVMLDEPVTNGLVADAGTGSTGDQGSAGTGSTGDQGSAGTGSTGDQGSAGTGSTEDQGSAGTGSTGDQGSAGTGSTGDQGSAGTATIEDRGSAGTGTIEDLRTVSIEDRGSGGTDGNIGAPSPIPPPDDHRDTTGIDPDLVKLQERVDQLQLELSQLELSDEVDESFVTLVSKFNDEKPEFDSINTEFARIESDQNIPSNPASEKFFNDLKEQYAGLSGWEQDAFAAFDATIKVLQEKVDQEGNKQIIVQPEELVLLPSEELSQVIDQFYAEKNEIKTLDDPLHSEFEPKRKIFRALPPALLTGSGADAKKDFDKVESDYQILNDALTATEAQLFTALDLRVSDLENQAISLRNKYGNVDILAFEGEDGTDIVNRMAAFDYRQSEINKDNFKRMVKTFAEVQSDSAVLAQSIEEEKALFDQLKSKDIGNPPDHPQLVNEYNDLVRRLNIVDSTYQDLQPRVTKSAEWGFTALDNKLAELKNDLFEQDDQFNAFLQKGDEFITYPIDWDEFAGVASDFADVKDATNNLENPFKSGRTVREAIIESGFNQDPRGAELVAKFNELDRDYNGLSSDVAYIEDLAFGFAGDVINNGLPGQIYMLDRELDALDSFGPPPDRSDELLKRLVAVKAEQEILDQDITDGHKVQNGLGRLANDEPAPSLIARFNAVEENGYKPFVERLQRTEAARINELTVYINDLDTRVNTFSSGVVEKTDPSVRTAQQIAQNVVPLRAEASILGKDVEGGRGIRDGLKLLAPTNTTAEQVLTRFNKLEAVFDGVNSSLDTLHSLYVLNQR
ncbi:hypothetical protein FACS1894172_04790 [Spirochaetia bacterium]|nr:hypothetical protein FACS1894172_04790 [Spirochaetia bacterium]